MFFFRLANIEYLRCSNFEPSLLRIKYINSFNPHTNSEGSTIIMPIWERNKLRHTEARLLERGEPGSKRKWPGSREQLCFTLTSVECEVVNKPGTYPERKSNGRWPISGISLINKRTTARMRCEIYRMTELVTFTNVAWSSTMSFE